MSVYPVLVGKDGCIWLLGTYMYSKVVHFFLLVLQCCYHKRPLMDFIVWE